MLCFAQRLIKYNNQLYEKTFFATMLLLLVAGKVHVGATNLPQPLKNSTLFTKVVCPQASATYLHSGAYMDSGGKLHAYSVWLVTKYNRDCTIKRQYLDYGSGSHPPDLRREPLEEGEDPIINDELRDEMTRRDATQNFSNTTIQ